MNSRNAYLLYHEGYFSNRNSVIISQRAVSSEDLAKRSSGSVWHWRWGDSRSSFLGGDRQATSAKRPFTAGFDALQFMLQQKIEDMRANGVSYLVILSDGIRR